MHSFDAIILLVANELKTNATPDRGIQVNENIAAIVHPVLDYGLALKSRLDMGTHIDIELEQARLQNLLLSEEESMVLSGYGRDTRKLVPEGALGDGQRMTSKFLGVRYALVCWLDEIFTTNELSKQDWTDRKLEASLYGTNDRAWKFWEQARLAQVLPGTSELEVFYLCVNLGFRGDRRRKPDELRSWVNQAKLRLGHVDELAFPYAGEQPGRFVPTLAGETRFQRMAVTCWAALLVVVPLVSFALVRRFGG